MHLIKCTVAVIVLGLSTTWCAASPSLHSVVAAATNHLNLAVTVKTYKVTLSKNSESKNREVFVQARDSSEARKTAKAQNSGWEVLLVSEVK